MGFFGNHRTATTLKNAIPNGQEPLCYFSIFVHNPTLPFISLRVFEYSLSYLEESSRLLNVPYSVVHTEDKPASTKTKNRFAK